MMTSFPFRVVVQRSGILGMIFVGAPTTSDLHNPQWQIASNRMRVLLLLPAATIFLVFFQGSEALTTSITSTTSDQPQHRRTFVWDTAKLALLTTTGFLSVAATTKQPAYAAAAAGPITTAETQNVAAQTIRYFRPKPPKLLRAKLSQDFAVSLMRSSYQVTDELDIVPMNQFQRDFFIIRSAEYKPYVEALGPGLVTQGDLTDPYYFDFISFAQYLTINRVINSNPPVVFEEKQAIDRGDDVPNEFVTTIVRRDAALTNDRLVSEHDRRVGLAILKKMDETFADTPLALPKNGNRPDVDQVLASLKQLTKLFLLNGYAMDGSAELVASPSVLESASGAKFCLTLVSPANLWSGQSLQFQRAKLQNDFLRKTAAQLLERLGYRVVSFAVKYDGNKELTYLTLQ